jgi:hypothetical protein
MIDKLTPKQQQLANLMSDISEECYYAGWMTGLEYNLWDAIVNGEKKYGHGQITQDYIVQLIQISKNCNSWIYFDDETEETAVDFDKWQNIFQRVITCNPKILENSNNTPR